MNCLTNICYVCLKTKDKSLVNINSSLSVHKDILHILGYLPCNLAWLKTEALVLICEECCRRLRETYLFFAMCLTNSAVLRGYMGKLNTASESNEAEFNSDDKSEIKLETEAVIKEELVDVLVNVIKIVDPCEEIDGKEESLMADKSIKNGSGQLWYPKYWSSGTRAMVHHGKKRTKADRTNTSGDFRKVKKSKDTKGTDSKECAEPAKQVLTKKAYRRYLKDVAEYARWMKPQEQREQQEQQQKEQAQQQKGQKKEMKKQKKLRKAKRKVFRKLLLRAKLHGNSTYEDFVKEYGQDERFQRVDSPEGLFQEHVNKLRKREMKAEESQRQEQVTNMNTSQQQQQEQLQEQHQQLEQQQQQEQQQEEQNSKNIDFRKLLSEANLHGNSKYRDFAKAYGHDARFQGVVKRASRTGLFREYLNQVRNRELKELHRQNHVSDFTELQQIDEGSC